MILLDQAFITCEHILILKNLQNFCFLYWIMKSIMTVQAGLRKALASIWKIEI